MRFSFELKGEVPAKKNSYRFSARGLYKPAGISDFEEMVYWTLKEKRAPHFSGPVAVELTFFTATNGDLDNKVTTLLDTLQDRAAGKGLIANDRNVMSILAVKFPCKKQDARVSVTVQDL